MPGYTPLHNRPAYSISKIVLDDKDQQLIPRYASPDLDPDEPYLWTRQGAAMSEEQEDYNYAGGEEEQPEINQNGRRNGVVDQYQTGAIKPFDAENHAGPSRKRTRNNQEHEHVHSNGNSRKRQTYPSRRVEDVTIPIIPSIFGISPRNEFTKTIGEFIMSNCSGRDNIEVN